MSNSSITRSPATAKKSSAAPSFSPVSKLLGNRPTAVQSLVSKVEAISFDAVPHQQHQPSLLDSASRTRPSSFRSQSPRGSPPISLATSPNLNGTSPHWEGTVRETPTIRHLKTSLRSRLQSDADRHQKRFSEDSGRSTDSADLHFQHASPSASPQKLRPASLQASSHVHSDWHAPVKSATSSSSNTRLAISSPEDLSPPPPLKEPTSSDDRSSSPEAHSRDSLPTNLSNEASPHKDTRGRSPAGVSASQEGCEVSFGTNPTPTEPPGQPPHAPSQHRPPANLPDLRIPLINFHLPPPTLAQWSVEAYETTGEARFADIITHLALLPLHTVLAITKKVPGAGRYLDLNPLFSQAEKDKQGILLTASQIATGLILASGWKVARRFMS